MTPWRRRQLLSAAGAWGLLAGAHAHPSHPPAASAATSPSASAPLSPPLGLVLPPQPAKAVALRTHHGRQGDLRQLLMGRITAVQLMFTGCSTSCPAQGATFAAAAAAGLPPRGQLLSISIDALGDDPKSLSGWLARFGAHQPLWQAAVPAPRDVDTLADWLKGAQGRSGTHTAQVFLFDALARLRYRTADEPAAQEVLSLLKQLAAVS